MNEQAVLTAPLTLPKCPAIYQIRNTVNGKIYVGSASNVYMRWHSHINAFRRGDHHNPALRAAVAKYGLAVFEMTVLELVASVGDLREREQFWLDQLRPFDPGIGYNISPSSRSNRGVPRPPVSAERRAKISAAQLGKPRVFSDEHRRNLSQALTGKKRGPRSAEHTAKIVAKLRGQRRSPEQVARIQAALKGKVIRRVWSAPHAKLTPDDVRSMRALYASGTRQRDLARQFNISPSQVCWILKGKQWMNV